MGLSSRAIVRRLKAWHIGEPLTRGQTIHTATAEPADRLLLVFLKMGGETRPWAVMWKVGSAKPKFRFVPEPRFRERIDTLAAELAPVLAAHLEHPSLTNGTVSEASHLAPRQIWLPNSSHVDMLHHFAYAYSFRPQEREHATELRLLGRSSLFAFLEAQRPGQQLLMSASDVLRSAYDFPAEDVRQAHLGFLLAWLSARGGGNHGLGAALEAEKQPVSTALLPELEREELMPLVDEHNEARRAGDTSTMDDVERKIGVVLRPELERRLALVQEAIDVIATDPRPLNAGVATLVRDSLETRWSEYVSSESWYLDRGLDPRAASAETDFRPQAAAARYFRYQAAADRALAALVHDDRELEAEAITAGDAFRGTIMSVTDEGEGRTTVPVWCIEDLTPGPLRLRAGDGVCVVGCPQREGRIRSIENTKGGGMAITLEITKCKTALKQMPWPHLMRGADERWIGHAVTIMNTSFATMTDRKVWKIRSRQPLPGDWILDTFTRREERAESQSEAADVASDDDEALV
jgi:hypothetical protein